MASTSQYISVKLHGSGVANCGDYPAIWANFTITFTRAEGSATVYWSTTGMGNWTHPTSGKFGYQFHAWISVSGQTVQPIIIKDNTTASNWWNYTTTNNPSGSFTNTTDYTLVRIYVSGGSGSCMSNGHLCYGSDAYRLINTYQISIPPYGINYTVDYDANGGTGAPASQTKSSVSTLTLSSQVPTYPLSILYHNNPDNLVYANKQFNGWLDDYSGTQTIYQPGDSFNENRDTTLVAQWGNASFTPIDLPDQFVTVTYNYNGGVGSPPSSVIARQELGYNTNSSATTADYVVGTSYNISNDLELYPIYGDAVLPHANLPVPTKEGFRFVGWYRDAELTDPIIGDLHTSTNITIYAKWIPLPIHQLKPEDNWGNYGPYVWKFNGTSWEKIAPVYMFSNGQWNNVSQ